MHSPALLSAVLLFTTSAFSSALTKRVLADSTEYDPATVVARADPPGSTVYVQGCKKYYKVQKGQTCNSIAESSKDYGKPFTADDFMRWNPSVGQDCRTMYADSYYCVDGPDPAGRKKDGKDRKGGSKHQKDPSKDPKRPEDGDQPPGGSTNPCDKWYTAEEGDTCLKIAYKKGISWDDFLQWNPHLVTLNRDNVKGCGQIKAGNHYCVGAPTAFRAVGFFHPKCTGAIHNDISVPPGPKTEDGVCINTDCKVGSLRIPPRIHGVIECPGKQVQISYFESKDCGGGSWFGYGYASQGDCHDLWKDGWPVQSLHLRCAPEKDDCATKGECRVDAEPLYPICSRPGILSLDH